MADCHLVAYRNAGLNPVAIAARNFDRTREVAERHKIRAAYETYQELLRDEKVEVVDTLAIQQVGQRGRLDTDFANDRLLPGVEEAEEVGDPVG